MAATMLEFGAQPSDSLPPFIASFVRPVHVDSILSEMEPAIVDDGSERDKIDVAPVPALETPFSEQSAPRPGPSQPSGAADDSAELVSDDLKFHG